MRYLMHGLNKFREMESIYIYIYIHTCVRMYGLLFVKYPLKMVQNRLEMLDEKLYESRDRNIRVDNRAPDSTCVHIIK